MIHCSWSNSVLHPCTVQESVTVFVNVYITCAKLLPGVNFEWRRWYFFARFFWSCGFVSRFRWFSALVLQGFMKIWELCTNIKYRWVLLMIVTYRRKMHNSIVWSRGKRILWEVDEVDSLPSEDYWQVSKAVSGKRGAQNCVSAWKSGGGYRERIFASFRASPEKRKVKLLARTRKSQTM